MFLEYSMDALYCVSKAVILAGTRESDLPAFETQYKPTFKGEPTCANKTEALNCSSWMTMKNF